MALFSRLSTFCATLSFLAVIGIGAQAQVAFVSNRADILATDTVDWLHLTEPYYSGTFTSDHGLTGSVYIPNVVSVGVQTMGANNGTDFAAGDTVFYDGITANPEIDVRFDTPVIAAGACMEPLTKGPYTGYVYAFDSSGTMIGSNSLYRYNAGLANGGAAFWGFSDPLGRISKLVFSARIAQPICSFGINQLSVRVARDNPVPEPSALVFLLTGGAPVLLFGLRRRKA